MPSSFWAETISTINYVKNLCISKSIDGSTPYELWTGRLLIIKHLKTFEEKAFFLNKSPNKGKFEARRIEGLFVGYSSTSKAYRIWVPNERKVVITRDVRFINKLQSDNKYEDIICDQTMNGRYKVLNESPADVEENETEIGPSIASEVNLENFNDIEIYHSTVEPLEDEITTTSFR